MSFSALRALRGISNVISLPFIFIAFDERVAGEYTLTYFLFGLLGVFLNLGLTQAGNVELYKSANRIDYRLLKQINVTRSLIFVSLIIIIPVLYSFGILGVTFLLALGYLFIPLLLPMEWLVNYYEKSDSYLILRITVTILCMTARVLICILELPSDLLFLSLSIEGVITFLLIKKKGRIFLIYPKSKFYLKSLYIPNIKLWLFDVMNAFKNRLDIYILSYFFLESVVGAYGVLLSTLNMIPLISNAVITVALPRIVSDIRLKWKIILFNLALVLMFISIWMICISKLGVYIYGLDAYLQFRDFILPTSCIGLMYGVNQAVNLHFFSGKKYSYLFFKTILSIVIILCITSALTLNKYLLTPQVIIILCGVLPIVFDMLFACLSTRPKAL